MDRPGDPVALLDDDTTSGGIGLAVWGFTTVVAVVLGFASWQYAPPRNAADETMRITALPSADDVTGSIATAERGAGTTSPTRVIGGSRITPMVLSPADTPITNRDVDQIRADLRDLQRRMAQMGLSGDGISRRLDRLEGRLTTLAAAATPASPVAAAKAGTTVAPVAAASSESSPPTPVADAASAPSIAPTSDPAPVAAIPGETTTADAVRIPQPRPETDLPIVTGSLPQKTPPAPAKADRQAPVPSVETVAVKPVVPPAPAAPIPPPAPPAAHAPASPVVQGATVAAIDLGGYRSLVSLKKSWSDMTERYAEFGTGMEALARLRETDSGMEARLVAGPYPNQSEAAKACLRMRALGVTCAVTGYTGQPLAALR